MATYKSVRIGAELLARMEWLAGFYGTTVNTVARKAVLSLERGNVSGVETNESAKSSTRRDGGTVVKVETDREPAEVRAAIAAYVASYEQNPLPPAPSIPDRVKSAERALSEQAARVERMTLETEIELLKARAGE